VALDATVRLGIRQGMMYRVLGQPVGGSREILDQRSVSKKVSWYDLTLMEEPSRASNQSATELAWMSSISEGAAIAVGGLILQFGWCLSCAYVS
jgi:hypothetical protein